MVRQSCLGARKHFHAVGKWKHRKPENDAPVWADEISAIATKPAIVRGADIAGGAIKSSRGLPDGEGPHASPFPYSFLGQQWSQQSGWSLTFIERLTISVDLAGLDHMAHVFAKVPGSEATESRYPGDDGQSIVESLSDRKSRHTGLQLWLSSRDALAIRVEALITASTHAKEKSPASSQS
jgi:hypothetical protein